MLRYCQLADYFVIRLIIRIFTRQEFDDVKMKLKKRKLKFAAIFGICWFAFLVLLVDGIIKFQTLLDRFGSYALLEITLILLVILPTVAVYFFAKE